MYEFFTAAQIERHERGALFETQAGAIGAAEDAGFWGPVREEDGNISYYVSADAGAELVAGIDWVDADDLR